MGGEGGEFAYHVLSVALGAMEIVLVAHYQNLKVLFTGRASILVNRHKDPFSKTLDRITGLTRWLFILSILSKIFSELYCKFYS